MYIAEPCLKHRALVFLFFFYDIWLYFRNFLLVYMIWGLDLTVHSNSGLKDVIRNLKNLKDHIVTGELVNVSHVTRIVCVIWSVGLLKARRTSSEDHIRLCDVKS